MESSLLSELSSLRSRYEELETRLSRPETVQNVDAYRSLMKEYSRISPVMEAFHRYRRAEEELAEAQSLLEGGEEEWQILAKSECQTCTQIMEDAIETIRYLLAPHDPDDDKSVIIEIRAAAGGEEAALFASDLYRMYTMYASAVGLRTAMMSQNSTELGGFRAVSFSVEGEGAFSRFRYESGVHRVQRVPKTESQGRIQTSTVTVAVLPEAEEIEVSIDPSDLVFESMKSSGAGGQHINKTESAVRLTHKPTGIVIECDGERSQFKNRDTALKMLRARLYEIGRREQAEAISSKRRSQVGSGDRSERIRTYNFPQSRITDHRIGYVSHDLSRLLSGEMDELIRSLRDADIANRTKETTNEG